MTTQSTMLHVRVDSQLKNSASQRLEAMGLTLSDAVRILLTRIVNENSLPIELFQSQESYDTWFKAKVYEALSDKSSTLDHNQVMNDILQTIESNKGK